MSVDTRSVVEKSLIRQNAERDATYAPYCLACPTMARMKILEPMLWKCASCGAMDDERSRKPEIAESPRG